MPVFRADLDRPQHQQAIIELVDHYARDPFGAGRPLAEEVRRILVDGLRNAGAVVFLATADGQSGPVAPAFIGLAVCLPSFSTFKARPVLNIHDLVVHQSARGQGVGRRLLAAVEEEARRSGCCKITLEVRADNLAAQQLYRSLGIAEVDGQTYFWSKSLG
jgi:ribosomal protein S18 acetylase RimI-like enzyme